MFSFGTDASLQAAASVVAEVVDLFLSHRESIQIPTVFRTTASTRKLKIISQSLNTQYLQYNYIQTLRTLAESKVSTFVIAPIDQKLTPLINVGK